jgi:cytochrome c5
MTKTIRIVSLLAICFGLSGAYAADSKPAEAKAATAAAPAAPVTPAKTEPAKAAPAAKAATTEPEVKKSNSNICHDKTSPGYKQTKNFKEFKTMDECVKSGGRPPKGAK